MELFWYCVSSILAGVGTGLAGLSAATVMVPIFITLCPSFAQENGVYQATAIALASDIIASAFTSYIYAQRKHIDLKRGSFMLISVLLMSIFGSYLAYLVGDIVLGSFSLFLTLAIGIQFLIKPVSGNKNSNLSGQNLSSKEIAISIFFGFCIGFDTGFVGTGGGMIMLEIFTLFLGMNQKTAVGTSTFIMTFAALIASVSHAWIDPAIIFEKWNTLIFCIVLSMISSILASQFANQVSEWVAGVVTGAVLTILGATMLILFYWNTLSSIPIIRGSLITLSQYLLYIIPFAISLVLVRLTFKVSNSLFRKMLHIAAFTSPIVIVLLAPNWICAEVTILSFAFLAYVFLSYLEHWEGYSRLLVEKRNGEIKRSLIDFFGMSIVLICLSWGIFKNPTAFITAIIMWGSGDAAAALMGKRFGKKKLNLPFVDPNKTIIGSVSMFFVSLTLGILSLRFLGSMSWLTALLISFIASLTGTYTEAICKNGSDTIWVPLVMTVTILALSSISL